MTLFTSVSLDSPVLETSVGRASAVTVVLEQQTMTDDGSLDLSLWAAGEDLRTFEDGLTADETISRWLPIGGADRRKLYRTRLTDRASSSINYHSWTDGRAVVLSAERTAQRWTVKAYVPERSVLQRFAEGCESNDVEFELLEIREIDRLRDTQQFGLSERQATTLLTAFDQGYYSVPRETSLEELARPLGVSHQAVSERLRRGVGSLIENTVAERWSNDPARPTDDGGSAPITPGNNTLERPIGPSVKSP